MRSFQSEHNEAAPGTSLRASGDPWGIPDGSPAISGLPGGSLGIRAQESREIREGSPGVPGGSFSWVHRGLFADFQTYKQ